MHTNILVSFYEHQSDQCKEGSTSRERDVLRGNTDLIDLLFKHPLTSLANEMPFDLNSNCYISPSKSCLHIFATCA